MSVVILLTACVNPTGMSFTKLQNPKKRLDQYKEALDWYLLNTNCRIVFVENTNCDISSDYSEFIIKKRLECLNFDGNSYDKSLGKGFGEGCIIKYALEHSSFLIDSSIIIKITGRIILNNVNIFLNSIENKTPNGEFVECDFNRKISMAKSIVIIATIKFYRDYFTKYSELINDSLGYEFENALGSAIRDFLQDGHLLYLFKVPVRLAGVSGTSNKMIQNHSFKFKVKKVLYFFKMWGTPQKSN
jgi:hypothetical protein